MQPDSEPQSQPSQRTVTKDVGMVLPGQQINSETSAREFILTTKQLIAHYGTIGVMVLGSLGINVIPGSEKKHEQIVVEVPNEIANSLQHIDDVLESIRRENLLLHGYSPVDFLPPSLFPVPKKEHENAPH